MRALILRTVSFVALAGASGQAFAQNEAAGASAVTDEIVVTAQHRAQSLQDTPLAISALTGDALRSTGATDISSLGNALANVSINVANGVPRITIRGIGSVVSQSNGESQVAFHVDGVYIGRPVATTDGMFDIERMEVVRGPQGTLYGRNATGGAINLITADPTDTLSGYAEGTVGNYSLFRFEGAISGPITDTLSARLAVQTVDRGGYGHDGAGRDLDDQKSRAVRAKLKYEPSPDFKMVLSAEYFHQDDFSSALHYAGPGDPDPNFPGDMGATFNRAFPLGGTVAKNLYRDTNGDTPSTYKKDNWALTGAVDVRLSDDATLTSIMSYREVDFHSQFDFDGTRVTLAWDPQFTKSKQFSHELRVGGSAGDLTYVVGAYYYFDDMFFQNRVVRDRRNFDPSLSEQLIKSFYQYGGVKTNAYAAFAQFSYELSEQFGIDVGGRYSSETKDRYSEAVVNIQPASFPYPTPEFLPNGDPNPAHAILTDPNQFYDPNLHVLDPRNLPGPMAVFPREEKTFNKFTPKVTVRFKPNDDIMAYATYSVGFRSGGYVSGSGSPAYLPEILKNYEAGLKLDLFDRRVQANFAGFYYDYSNLQVTRINPAGGANLVDNAGSAELYGVEFNFDARATDDLKIDGQLGWLHARYKKYSSVDSNRPSLGVIDLRGNQIALAPEWTASGGIQYTWHPSFGDVTLRGEAKYTSKVYFTPFNTERYSEDGFVFFDAYLNVTGHNGLYGGLYMKNIANKDVWASLTGLPVSLGGTIGGTAYAPRTFGARVGYRF
ncbi:MAG: TonB-dependent receptor [Sphingobium sp.]